MLPADLPNRALVVAKTAEHLRLIVEANAVMNLTRIVSPRDAAIKHVLDSVIPWQLFQNARHVLDAGTGPGFPGIPLALVLPETRFTLCESTGKKARFVDSVAAALPVPNVTVSTARAEDLCREVRFGLITARAFAPIPRALGFLAPALHKGARLLLYKGPDAEQEIAAAAAEIRRFRVTARIVSRYELPDAMGTRTVVEIAAP